MAKYIKIVLIGASLILLIFALYRLSLVPTISKSVSNTSVSQTPKSSDSDDEQQKLIFKLQEKERHKFNMFPPEIFEQIESIVPQISCPNAVRLGYVGDGGKWVCRPWRHNDDCIVYSFGVGFSSTFEQEIVKFTNCSTYSFDPENSSTNLFVGNSRLNFRPWKVSERGGTNTSNTVKEIMTALGHREIEILKIDVELGEYSIMPTIFELSKTTQICQVLTEVHEFTNVHWRNLLAQYERADFYIFSREPNWGCSPKACVEYAHMHKSCLAKYGIGLDKLIIKNFPPLIATSKSI